MKTMCRVTPPALAASFFLLLNGCSRSGPNDATLNPPSNVNMDSYLTLSIADGTSGAPGTMVIKNNSSQKIFLESSHINSCLFARYTIATKTSGQWKNMIYDEGERSWKIGDFSLICLVLAKPIELLPGDSHTETLRSTLPTGYYKATIRYFHDDTASKKLEVTFRISS